MVCSGPLYEESLQQQRSITTNLFKKCKFRKQFSGLSLWLNIWNGDPQTMKGRRVLLLLGDRVHLRRREGSVEVHKAELKKKRHNGLREHRFFLYDRKCPQVQVQQQVQVQRE